MANGHNSIKRIVQRSCEEIGATVRIARATSWPEAINTFRAKLDIQVMSRNGYKEPPEVRERLLRKHETVLKYLEGRFGDYYASYDYGAPLPPLDPALEGKIWMCWWQGEENAPEIVRACIDSVRRNAGGHEVVVITDENLSEYVDIPEWVLEKVRAGVMSRTNLSDLLRLSLLAEHGGMWLDATFFCSGSLKSYQTSPCGPSRGPTTCMRLWRAACLPVTRSPAMPQDVAPSLSRVTSSWSTGARATGLLTTFSSITLSSSPSATTPQSLRRSPRSSPTIPVATI